jgi:DNA-binding transcriptional LysR family regulator
VNLHQLELFCAILEKGSFSLAARELYISQPALSIQIKRLEESVGVSLLRRSRGGVQPTLAGSELYASAHRAMEQLRAAEHRLAAIRQGAAGTLVVGTSHTGSLYFLADLVAFIHRGRPQVLIDVDVIGREQEMQEKLSQGVLDVVIAWGPRMPPELDHTSLLDVDFAFVAAPGRARRLGGRLTREVLRRTPVLSVQGVIGTPTFVDIWMIENDLLPQGVFRSLPSVDAVKRLVEADVGVAMLSAVTVRLETRDGRLAILPLDAPPLRRPLVVVTRREAHSPQLELFLSAASEFASNYHSTMVAPRMNKRA